MPVNTAQSLIGKERARSSGELSMLEYFLEESAYFVAFNCNEFSKLRFFRKSPQSPVHIFSVMQLAAEVIRAKYIPHKQSFVQVVCQNRRQAQVFHLIDCQSVFRKEARQGFIRVENIGILIRPVKGTIP